MNSLKNKTPNKLPNLDEFYEHFANINMLSSLGSEEDTLETTSHDIDNDGDEILNSEITASGVQKCIRNLKNSKFPRTDDILNEYMKFTSFLLMPLYTLRFNNILEIGIILSK